MSIATEIERLQSAKSDIKTAIEAKGVTVPSSTTLDGYADYVSAISQSGSGVGNLTKYQQVKVTPSVTAELTAAHNLGVIPKIAIIHIDQTTGSSNIMESGIMGETVGSMYVPTGEAVRAYNVINGESQSSNSAAYITSTSITIRRASSAVYFSTSNEYTIDLYA